MNTNSMQDKPVPWHHRILKDQPESDPQYWSDSLRLVYVMRELEEYRLAFPNPLAEPVQPVEVDQATMELAESVGLIGPTSRTHELHAAIQRFHDLICANATIKAAKMAADAIRESTPPAAPVREPVEQALDKKAENARELGLDYEPVALHAMAKRRIFDAIRGAYDLGYNDARGARAVHGDSAPGYKGRDVEADHGGALISALGRYTTQPAPAQPAQQETVGPLKEADVLIMAEAHGIDPNTKGLYGFYIDCISTNPPAPAGKAPCARHCEATAFQITIRGLRGDIERMKAAQPAQRQPLTDEQIDKLWMQNIPSGMNGTEWRRGFVRAIEQALAAQPAQQGVTVPDLTHDAWDEWQDKHSLILEREALDDLRSMLAAAQPTPCTWTKAPDHNMPDTYNATCGVVWTFNDGGPAENGMVFCPGCARKVTKGDAS